jgi:hypothetical protein
MLSGSLWIVEKMGPGWKEKLRRVQVDGSVDVKILMNSSSLAKKSELFTMWKKWLICIKGCL